MKKIVIMLVVLLSGLFVLTGCGNSNVEGSLEDIMTSVYSKVPEDQRPMGLTNMEINSENVLGFLGTEDIEYKEALASESMVGSIAHSVVLVRVKEGANVEEVKKEIKENIDPRKWICVWVEEEDVIIKNKGDLIIVIMVEDEETRTKLEKGFDEL